MKSVKRAWAQVMILVCLTACGGGAESSGNNNGNGTAAANPGSTGLSASPAPASRKWVAAWADSPDSAAGPGGSEQTFRQIVKPSVGSRGTVRLHFSNTFGTRPVTLGAVHVGIQSSRAAVRNDVRVTFGGAGSVTIPAGGSIASDNVPLAFAYGDVLAVTEYVSGSWTRLTQHTQGPGIVTSYATAANAGDKTQDTAGASFTQNIVETYLLDRVDVFGDYAQTVAAFGSSSTDGMNSGADRHLTYPEQLADALHAAGRDDVAVVNAGISGTTVLGGGFTTGIVRFKRDVLDLPGLGTVIDYLGANDLRINCVSANALIAGKRDIAAQARAAGVKFHIGLNGPSTFCGKLVPAGPDSRFAQGSGEEAQRFLLHAWARSTRPITINGVVEAPPQIDGVIDFHAALADPANESYLRPAFDSGDHVHPNAAGYGAMAKAVPLSLF